MSIFHAILDLAGLTLLIVTLPLVCKLLILSLAALLPPRTIPTSSTALRLAVIIPAHNEQELISTCVESLRSSSPESVQIYVVAHNCTDLTAERATTAGAKVLTLNDEVGGKGNALHHGFTHALAAGAEAVLVIDADSTVADNLTQQVARALAAGSRALQARYTVANVRATPRTRLMGLAFLGMNVLRPRGRSRLGLSCGIFGNGFALTADTLRRVPYVANSVVEDLEYHLHLLRAGIRVDFLDNASVMGEMPEQNAGASSQRARWEGGRILMRRQWTLPLCTEVFTGRLRMLEPLLDLLCLPLATNAVLLLVSLVLPLGWLRVYSAVGMLSLVLYVLVSASLDEEPYQVLRSLLSVPGYLFWKLALIPRTRLAARRDASWVRTRRNAEQTTPEIPLSPYEPPDTKL